MPILYKRTVLTIIVSVLVLSSTAPTLAISSLSANQQLRTEMQETRDTIIRAPANALLDKPAILREYDAALNQNRGWLSPKHDPCHTLKKLTQLLDRLERKRQRQADAALEELYIRVWTLRQNLLANLPDSQSCSGFTKPSAAPETQVKTSDNQHFAFTVQFPLPKMTIVKGADQTFTRLHMPGLEEMVGKPGEPAIPRWRTLIGLPEGSKPQLKLVQTSPGEDLRLNLVPFQEQAIDATPNLGNGDTLPEPAPVTFADKPFIINEQTYRQDASLPADPCVIQPMGQYRDLQVAQLDCATGQYNPVTGHYKLFHGYEIEVTFEGSQTGNFVTSRSLSPFESNHSAVTDAVLNKAVIDTYVSQFDLSNLPCSGEELLILTHSNFRTAADTLAEHKRAIGLATNVFNVGSGIPTRDTAVEIDKFIENRYDACHVRPSYVMLLGDAEFIPTFYPAGLPDNAGSDFPYSNYVQFLFDAFFPDFGVGRIPVDTLAQADTVVDKIIKYESSPPFAGLGNGAPFYTTAGLASQFQCCRMNADGTPLSSQPGTDQRAFIQTTELVRNELLVRGYTAPRLYTRTVDGGGYCLRENAAKECILRQSAYSGDTTPRRYFNGDLLPAGIAPDSGFAWDADTADVSAAWNEGRFLMLHRDHGWPGGWGDPGFGNVHVDDLTNGDKLPVVFSVNCASGMFDNETAGGTYGTNATGVYWAERALRKADGGAIGIIGDTRNSPTWANNALTRGFFDAVWPNTVPGFGASTRQKRLGDILNWGKVYLATQVGVDQPAGDVTVGDMGYEYNIWHVIGDPTLKMWTANPRLIDLSKVFKVEVKSGVEVLQYATDATVITKLQTQADGSTMALGRATVENGFANMDLVAPADPELPVSYSASQADAVSVSLQELRSGQQLQ